jgi:hypothetical protein
MEKLIVLLLTTLFIVSVSAAFFGIALDLFTDVARKWRSK